MSRTARPAGAQRPEKKVIFAFLRPDIYHPSGAASAELGSPASLPLGPAAVMAAAAADPEIAVAAGLRGLTLGGDPQAAAAKLASLAPDVAAFSCFTLNAAVTLRAARLLKRLRPGVKIALGGALVPRNKKLLSAFLRANPALDAAFFGEGEDSFRGWLKPLLRGEEPPPAAGLGLRRGGRILCSEKPSLPDLAALPSPYLTGAISIVEKNRGILALETGRGCPYSCAYCATDAAQRALRSFPLSRLAGELAWLDKTGFRGTAWLVDPIINLDRERAARVFKMLARRRASFMLNIRAENLDAGLIRLLAGIRGLQVAIGVQTVNPAAMRALGRISDLELAARNIRALQAGCPELRLGLQMILGLPGDNYESFKATLDWCLAFGGGSVVNILDLLLLDNSPLKALRGRLGIKARPDGIVTSSRTFTAPDMAKASRVAAVYYAVSQVPALQAGLHRAGAARGACSLVLEEIAGKALAAGLLPSRRLVIDTPGCLAGLDRAFLARELAAR